MSVLQEVKLNAFMHVERYIYYGCIWIKDLGDKKMEMGMEKLGNSVILDS